MLRVLMLACAACVAGAAGADRRATAGSWNYDRCGPAPPRPAPPRRACAPGPCPRPAPCATHCRPRVQRSHHARATPPPCRCDGVNGPAHWPGGSVSSHCDAAEQSPIDLCGASVHPLAPNLTFAAGYGIAQNYRFSADGKAYIDAAAGLGLTLDAGNLVRQRVLPARHRTTVGAPTALRVVDVCGGQH